VLPNKSDNRWRQIVKGEIKHQFSCFPASMCVNRCIREISKNPSEEVIRKSIDEVYNFFNQFQNIMQDDIKKLFN